MKKDDFDWLSSDDLISSIGRTKCEAASQYVDNPPRNISSNSMALRIAGTGRPQHVR